MKRRDTSAYEAYERGLTSAVVSVGEQITSSSRRLCSRLQTLIILPFEGGFPGKFFVGPRRMSQ